METLQLDIEIIDENASELVISLKEYLEDEIPEIESIKVHRKTSQTGSMSGGELSNILGAIIKEAVKPLTELVKCIQIWIQAQNTEIRIKKGKNEIVINTNNTKKAEDLVKLLLEKGQKL